MGLDRAGGVWHLLLRAVWLLLAEFNFWGVDLALAFVCIQIWDFPIISLFPNILRLKSSGKSWGNSCTKFIILDITSRFTCGEFGSLLKHCEVRKYYDQDCRLNSIDFNEDNVLTIIRALNIYKAHSHDDISIRMIKICDKSLLKPLILLFENSTKSSCYPDIWKGSNTIPAHEKNDQQLVNNHRPISLLPFLEKYLKKLSSIIFTAFC